MGLAAIKASSILWRISKRNYRSNSMIFPLSSVLFRPHLEKMFGFHPQVQEKCQKNWEGPMEGHQYGYNTGELHIWRNIDGIEFIQSRRLRRNLITLSVPCVYLWRRRRYSLHEEAWQQDKENNLLHNKFSLDIRKIKIYLYKRKTEHCPKKLWKLPCVKY